MSVIASPTGSDQTSTWGIGDIMQHLQSALGIVAIIVLLCALALAWRYTPLRELINTDALAIIADDFAGSPFAPVMVVAAYIIGGLAANKGDEYQYPMTIRFIK